jgi:hypothetical protein
MFEKIGRHAEMVATSVSLSRRGLLSRLGQAAIDQFFAAVGRADRQLWLAY